MNPMQAEQSLFINAPVRLMDLPSVDDLPLAALEPAYLKVRVWTASIAALAAVLGVWGLAFAEREVLVAGYTVAAFFTLAALWFVAYQALSFRYMGYAVRERDITFRTGWWWQTTATIPFNRVQHCEIRQGLLERRLGLAKLTIYTAGGESSDMEIPGLQLGYAEKLKSYILGATEQAVEQE